MNSQIVSEASIKKIYIVNCSKAVRAVPQIVRVPRQFEFVKIDIGRVCAVQLMRDPWRSGQIAAIRDGEVL
jgi:hypothetical protein